MAHACYLIIYEAETEEFLVLTGQFSWLRESSNFIERPWLKQSQKKSSDDDPEAIKQRPEPPITHSYMYKVRNYNSKCVCVFFNVPAYPEKQGRNFFFSVRSL